ncbi:hypothetical protein RI367_004484 [Sorochytrium milnesiophthora]
MSTEKKTTSSALDVSAPSDATTFGSRVLQDEAQVFEQNAWDHVEWTKEQELKALELVAAQHASKVPQEEAQHLVDNASEHWNEFYDRNQDNFFKDRNWLEIEFPELFAPLQDGSTTAPFVVLEVGCGAGNTVLPLVSEHRKRRQTEAASRPLFVYACDFAESAVQVVKNSPLYDPADMKAFVYDLSSADVPVDAPAPGTVDVLILVFVLSALHPDHWTQAMLNVNRFLRPGGLLLFRDYGRHDLAQLRMKGGRLISDNFYRRGDNTLVYFFTPDDIRGMVEQHGFRVEQLAVDRRLIVNRRKQLQMHRVWLQGKFRKPSDPPFA